MTVHATIHCLLTYAILILPLQGAHGEMVITRNPLLNALQDIHTHTLSAAIIPSHLRPLLIHQLNDVGEVGNIREARDGTFHWRFDTQNLVHAEKITSVSSQPFRDQFGNKIYLRLYLNSNGTRYKANTASFFVVMIARSRPSPLTLPLDRRVSVALHNNRHSLVQLKSDCDFSLGRHDDRVRNEVVSGCRDFVSVDKLRQTAKCGTVCIDIQFLI